MLLESFSLCCPNCKSISYNLRVDSFMCSNCHSTYPLVDSKLIIKELEQTDLVDSFDKLKFKLKRFSSFYDFLIRVISPVCPTSNYSRIYKKYFPNTEVLAINIGSGNSKLSASILNIDVFSYDNVDIVCDIENLPFKDESVDVVFNIAVLEHVPNPEKVVAEIFRVLKKGGMLISFFPFMQPFHASPYDFSRRTSEGMKVLYKDFEIIELKPEGGPTSGLLWVFQEWLAIFFSMGLKPLYIIFSILIMLFTFPLKFLDLILVYHPMAKNISSGFLYIGKRR